MLWLILVGGIGYFVWNAFVSKPATKQQATALARDVSSLLQQFQWTEQENPDLGEEPWCSWDHSRVPLEFYFETERLLRSVAALGSGEGFQQQELNRIAADATNLHRILERRWTSDERRSCRAIAWGYLFGRAQDLESSSFMMTSSSELSGFSEACGWFEDEHQLEAAKSLLGSSGVLALTEENLRAESSSRAGLRTGDRHWAWVSLKRARQLTDSLTAQFTAEEAAEERRRARERDARCSSCKRKALPNDRFCAGCGALLR